MYMARLSNRPFVAFHAFLYMDFQSQLLQDALLQNPALSAELALRRSVITVWHQGIP
jgi:hypothetical protein